MTPSNLDLTLEQQFRLKTLETAFEHMTLEEARRYVKELTVQGMLKDNLMRTWIRGLSL